VIKKPNGDVRLMSNMKRLNDPAKKGNTHRLPGMKRNIERMAGSR
jgi:hypothetical protein